MSKLTRVLSRLVKNQKLLQSQRFFTVSPVTNNAENNNKLSTGEYSKVYYNSINRKEEFWHEVAQDIVWDKPYTHVLDPKSSPTSPRWFAGGELNTCYNAVDRHVDNGRQDSIAIIYDSPVTGTKSKLTYGQLQDQVRRMAGVLSNLGVTKGDRILLYLPMIPEAIVSMLATTRLGAIHSVVFGGFAAPELSKRIAHLKPKVVISASCGIEPSRTVEYKPLLDTAIKISAHKPTNCVIFQRPNLPKAPLIRDRDIDWAEAMEYAKGHEAVPVESNHPCNVLYTY